MGLSGSGGKSGSAGFMMGWFLILTRQGLRPRFGIVMPSVRRAPVFAGNCFWTRSTAYKADCTVPVTQSVCDEQMDLLRASPTFVPFCVLAVRYSRWWMPPWCGRGGVSGDAPLRCGGVCSCFRAGQHLHGVKAGDGLAGAGLGEGQDGTNLVPHGLGLCLGDHQAVEAAGGNGQVELVGAVAVAEHFVGEVQPVGGRQIGLRNDGAGGSDEFFAAVFAVPADGGPALAGLQLAWVRVLFRRPVFKKGCSR